MIKPTQNNVVSVNGYTMLGVTECIVKIAHAGRGYSATASTV